LISQGREVLAGTVNEIRRGPLGGKTLCVEFVEAFDQPRLSYLRENPAIQDILIDGPTRITARFAVDADLTFWLMKLNELGPIQSFHSGTASLHDIYLRSVGSSNGLNQQEIGA
jgi:ABC-type uncharacterized transport system ATPase subunit